MSKSRVVAVPLFLFFIALVSTAPTKAKAQGGTSAPPPVAYSSVNELSGILTDLQQTAQSMQADLSKLRIDKWKTDGSTKRQTQGNADSLKRNLESALPDLIAQLNAAPEDVAASFKLYRNLDALYDVFGSVVESAGAFGSKDEFQSLSNDMSGLENARRSLGERVQKLTESKEEVHMPDGSSREPPRVVRRGKMLLPLISSKPDDNPDSRDAPLSARERGRGEGSSDARRYV